MKYQFWANLTIIFQLDDATFTLLENSMRHHYDYTVKSAVEQGGFIYGLRGRRDFLKDKLDDEHRNTLELSSRQLQLCMKALEMRHYHSKDTQEPLEQLNTQLHKLWFAYAAQMEVLNKEYLAAGGEV